MKYDLKSNVLPNNHVFTTVKDNTSSNKNSNESDNIKFIIDNEKLQKEHIDTVMSNISSDESKLLEHLGDYIEEPYNRLLNRIFEGQHLGTIS
jgi:hypothetical protein